MRLLPCINSTTKRWLLLFHMQGVAELLLDSNATQDAPRPGTSLNRPMTKGSGIDQSMRPVTRLAISSSLSIAMLQITVCFVSIHTTEHA
jgi:hypothetical protein